METHKIYENENFLNEMSQLFPIASNFLNDTTIPIPINRESTIATLNKLFKKENVTNDPNYSLNLWNNFPHEFVSKFMSFYWWEDPLTTLNINVNSLNSLNFNAKQYILLSLINIHNRNSDDGLIYDLSFVKFNNLTELAELFNYMGNLKFYDFSQHMHQILNENITQNIPFKTNKEIQNELKEKYQKEDEQEQLILNQKIMEMGISKPTLSESELTLKMQILLAEINKMFREELSILRNFSKRETELIEIYKSHINEKTLENYFTEREAMLQEQKLEISNVYVKANDLKIELENLTTEISNVNAHDNLKYEHIRNKISELSQLSNIPDRHIVFVDQNAESIH